MSQDTLQDIVLLGLRTYWPPCMAKKKKKGIIFNLNNLEINIVGDISATQSKSLIHLITNNFSTTKESENIEYNINSVKSHTDFDSTQSHLTIVIPAVSRKHDNYHDLMVANYILGGSGFGSWQMEEIKQKRDNSKRIEIAANKEIENSKKDQKNQIFFLKTLRLSQM